MWCPKKAWCPFNARAVTRNPCLHSNQHHTGKVLNKRVALAVDKTSKPWQIGCRPGFGTELPSLVSTEFLAMCQAAIVFAHLKGAFYHVLLKQNCSLLLL